MGDLGFLVLRNVESCKSLIANGYSILKLDGYGMLYGTLVLSRVQNLIKENILPFNLESLSGKINTYIPFGKNRCVCVFLDIRKLSDLLCDDNKNDDPLALRLLHEFSDIAAKISRIHLGVVTGHFGGGMLITFKSTKPEMRDWDCFRAICVAEEIQCEFKRKRDELLKNKNIEIIGDAIANANIGIGINFGDVFFSAFNSSCVYYTGIGEDIGFAKKIEWFSGRKEDVLRNIDANFTMSSEDKIFISAWVEKRCQSHTQNGVHFQEVENVILPHSKSKSGCGIYYLSDGTEREKCPLPESYKCPRCKQL
jgi:hypothetical protein